MCNTRAGIAAQVKPIARIRRDALPLPAIIFKMSFKAPIFTGQRRKALAGLSPEPASSRPTAHLGKWRTSAIVRLLPPVPAMSPTEEQANRKALRGVAVEVRRLLLWGPGLESQGSTCNSAYDTLVRGTVAGNKDRSRKGVFR